jgi:hypothetical protein
MDSMLYIIKNCAICGKTFTFRANWLDCFDAADGRKACEHCNAIANINTLPPFETAKDKLEQMKNAANS